MKWEDFMNMHITRGSLFSDRRHKTDIDCPECGKKIYRRDDIVLASNPPKYQYECDCGWVGYADF